MAANKKKIIRIASLAVAGVLVVGLTYSVVSTYLYESKKKPIVPSGQTVDLTDYRLVFEDNFDGDKLDLEKWSYRANGARRAGFNSPNQVYVKDGNLYMKAEYKEDGEYGPGWYTGMIRTISEYTTGYFEARCKANEGGGFWSAFWLNSPGMNAQSDGGINGAEIDIFEAFNYDKKTYFFSQRDSVSLNIHVDGYGEELKSKNLGNYYVKDPYNEFHIYGLEWTPSEYIFYIDGVEACRSTFKNGVSKGLEYVILSLEPPSEVTAEPGFSTEFVVDYVKIYQK